MKRSLTLILITVLCVGGYAQKADDILGIYFCVDPFSKKQSQAEIYKAKDGTYEAKVVWTNDIKGQDQIGLVFMKGLTYNAEDKEYQNGKIQYPGRKGTYKAYVRIVDGGKTLKMRGYLGVSMFGMTVDWKREEKVRPAPTK
jgi:uncharacterized protein (DUF2147 family)